MVLKWTDNRFVVSRALAEASDNVSAVKTIGHPETKQPVTVFGTYNGRVSYFA